MSARAARSNSPSSGEFDTPTISSPHNAVGRTHGSAPTCTQSLSSVAIVPPPVQPSHNSLGFTDSPSRGECFPSPHFLAPHFPAIPLPPEIPPCGIVRVARENGFPALSGTELREEEAFSWDAVTGRGPRRRTLRKSLRALLHQSRPGLVPHARSTSPGGLFPAGEVRSWGRE